MHGCGTAGPARLKSGGSWPLWTVTTLIAPIMLAFTSR